MRSLPAKKYTGKVLLFGEYTVIDGSAALAIPMPRFYGKWTYENTNNNREGLLLLKRHVAQLYYDRKLDNVDFDQFERDITRGLSFDSSIPLGYGLGSSGALTAAFYDHYVIKNECLSLSELKDVLASIEGAFHGSSSGLDPLVSYLNMPLLVHPDGDIELLDIDRSELLENIRLLDTGMRRHTAPLVDAYKKTRQASHEFREETEHIAEVADQLITAYVLGDHDLYHNSFKEISNLQLRVFSMLIPESIRSLWQQGLESEAFYTKLCGAGGGGCFLFTICDEKKTDKIVKEQKVLSIR